MITILYFFVLTTLAAAGVSAVDNKIPCPSPNVPTVVQCTFAQPRDVIRAYTIDLPHTNSINKEIDFGSTELLGIKVTPSNDKVKPSHILLVASGLASDRKRVFSVTAGETSQYVWLSGNGKGAGAQCQIDINLDYAKIADSKQYAYEWGSIPADQCW